MRTHIYAAIGLTVALTLSVYASAQQRGTQALLGAWIGDLGPWTGDAGGGIVTLNLKADGGQLTGVVSPNSPQPILRSTCTGSRPVEVLAFDPTTGAIRLQGDMFAPRGIRGTYRYSIEATVSRRTIIGNWADDSGSKRSITLARDVVTGLWKGDGVTGQSERREVFLELKWDGPNVTGTARSIGSAPVDLPLSKTKFDAATGAIHLEADVPGRGAPARHVIEGTIVPSVDGVGSNTMSGAWSSNGSKGDFKLTKQ